MTGETLPPATQEAHAPAPWWRSAAVHQEWPQSFADAEGDGTGDLHGTTAPLNYLAELGVDAIWISPLYRSPRADAGYDLADHRPIDPAPGTLEDLDASVTGTHRPGPRAMIDLVPNHTSDQHTRFGRHSPRRPAALSVASLPGVVTSGRLATGAAVGLSP